MPLLTAPIQIYPEAPYASWAQFFSVLAYPDELDHARRVEFGLAIQIKMVGLRIKVEPAWASRPQPIYPQLVNGVAFKNYSSVLKRGNRQLQHRFLCAQYIFLPNLAQAHSKLPILVDGYSPSLTNMSLLINRLLGGEKDSTVATVKHRIWKPSRPVVAAAAGLLMWMKHHLTDDEEQNARLIVQGLFSTDSLREVLGHSRSLRFRAHHDLPQYELRKKHTIRFVTSEFSEDGGSGSDASELTLRG